ncbi:hypothetical protein DFH06DRAFT_1471806 [Mycena polygramma]|nr:hypothetical protein DFH06DRAFT_1471806 [Mycena polygramma]
MAHLTTALLGSVSRLFFPPSPTASAPALGLSHSKSDPDLAQHTDTHLRPASSTSVRPRPASAMAIEGYWGWDVGVEGMTLRRRTRTRTERDVGLKVRSAAPLLIRVLSRLTDIPEQAQADVQITDASPVLACQPPRPACTGTPLAIVGVPAHAAAAAPNYTLELRADAHLSFDISLISDTWASSADEADGDSDISGLFTLEHHADSEPDSSFDVSLDISLISDTSTSASDTSSDGDISFGSFSFPPCLPPPPPSARTLSPLPAPAPAAPLGSGMKGLGITGLFKPSGAPFDGMGLLSFGYRGASPSTPSRCHTHTDTGLSRTFLEELEATWAEDPQHLRLGVIDEEPEVSVGASAQDAENDVCARDTDKDANASRSRRDTNTNKSTSRRVERETISSGLKRKPVSVIPARGARRGVWRA